MTIDEDRIACDGLRYCIPWMNAAERRIRFLEEIIEEAILAHNCGGTASMVAFRMGEALLPYSQPESQREGRNGD